MLYQSPKQQTSYTPTFRAVPRMKSYLVIVSNSCVPPCPAMRGVMVVTSKARAELEPATAFYYKLS